MRRLAQLVLLALAAPGVVLLGPVVSAQAATAHAATARSLSPAVLQTAWFWQTAYEQVSPPVAPPAAPPSEPSGVPKGDLAVAATSTDGTSSKMSVVSFNLAGVEPGSTVDTFTVTLTVDGSGSAVNAGTPAVVACLPTRIWAPADGGDYTNEPPVDCTAKVAPKISGSSYAFAIPAIAQHWVDDENLGVAFVAAPGTSQPFQTVFSGAKAIKVTATVTPPAPRTPVTAAGHNTGSSTAGGSSASAGGGTAPAAASQAAPPPVQLPPSGPATTVAPTTGAAPQVAAPTAPLAASRAARVLPSAPASPGGGFWLAAIGIALLLLTAGVVLGDSRVPVPTAATTRLSRVLRERELERARQGETTPSFVLRSV